MAVLFKCFSFLCLSLHLMVGFERLTSGLRPQDPELQANSLFHILILNKLPSSFFGIIPNQFDIQMPYLTNSSLLEPLQYTFTSLYGLEGLLPFV